jgi:RNA 2'-phosphotransferase, Tpt1 / KptA family
MLKTTLATRSKSIFAECFIFSVGVSEQAFYRSKGVRFMASSRSLEEDMGIGEMDLGREEREEMHDEVRKRGRGGGEKGKRGGRGGGREVEVSKALSKLLRHAAESQGIKLNAEGYAPLEQVVSGFFL